MISTNVDLHEAKAELQAKIAGMRNVLLDFADLEAPLASHIARETIFNGEGPHSLQVRTGSTQAAGLLSRRLKKFSGKSNFAGEAYWSRMTNIHDNFKNRKRLGLLNELKKQFKTDSKVNSIFENAMKNFEAIT